jgi:hypothetical protein
MNPPSNIVKRITSSGEPFGSAEVNPSDQRGASAPTAPKIVIRPRTSVIDRWDSFFNLLPTAMPIAEPITIATTLMVVPRPINIDGL